MSEAIRELSSLKLLLASRALLGMLKEVADELTRFATTESESGSSASELCKSVSEVLRRWIPKCVKLDIAAKVVIVLYALSIVAVSAASALVWGSGSLLEQVGAVVTTFMCGAVVLGALLGLSLTLLAVPLLPIVAVGQCAYLSVSNHFFLWVCLALAISIVFAVRRTWVAIDSYRRALLEVLRISNAISRILEGLTSAAEARRREELESKLVPIGESELEKIYGSEAGELLKYSEEVKKLR